MNAKPLNAGIVILQDGTTPCIAVDSALPHPLKHVEFNRNDYLLTLVYDTKDQQTDTFDYPLGHDFVELLSTRKNIAVAQMKNKQVSDIKMFSIIFVEK